MPDTAYSSVIERVPLDGGERCFSNRHWHDADPCLSILVPTFRDDPTPLLRDLAQCRDIAQGEVILYDDGSCDEELVAAMQRAIDAFPGAARLVSNNVNRGRAHGRNRLEAFARSDWLLFLDADMLPDSKRFVQTYLRHLADNPTPAVIVGGFSLKRVPPSPATELHFAQCAASECVPAKTRSQEPGRFVFTSNLLVHRDVMAVIPFDDDFVGWGWEDVDWGLRAARRFNVTHLDNTASHLGLDQTRDLMRKYKRSGGNFRLLIEKHRDEMSGTPLYRAARLLRWNPFPVRTLLRWGAAGLARAPRPFPLGLRLKGLKLYRACVYGEALRD